MSAFPANIVPENICVPCCWIWNTDKQNEEGKHWVAVWLTKKKMYFFDSFAKSSFYSREYWGNLAKKINVKFTYVQTRSLQSMISYTCGSWCLLYLYNKSRNEIEKTDQYYIRNKKFKHKINNDINFKKKS